MRQALYTRLFRAVTGIETPTPRGILQAPTPDAKRIFVIRNVDMFLYDEIQNAVRLAIVSPLITWEHGVGTPATEPTFCYFATFSSGLTIEPPENAINHAQWTGRLVMPPAGLLVVTAISGSCNVMVNGWDFSTVTPFPPFDYHGV